MSNFNFDFSILFLTVISLEIFLELCLSWVQGIFSILFLIHESTKELVSNQLYDAEYE